MARRIMTVERFLEIKRMIGLGLSDRKIAQALRCRRDKVAAIRCGHAVNPAAPKAIVDPIWMISINWDNVTEDLGKGHPLKFIWEERAQGLTTYSNFWKQFYRKFPQYRDATVTLRQFAPGERVEVDYAGDKIEWINLKTLEIKGAVVFVSGLGFSQLLFAWASDDMKSKNWQGAHRRMYEFFGGVPRVTVPDCLKQGVIKCHIYDPDLNSDYAEMAAHFGTAIVPARPRHPKDKAIVEGLVKILMRYFKFCYRRHTFTSIVEINNALRACADKINRRPHSRFSVSRLDRFNNIEKQALKALPVNSFEVKEWKKVRLHADCTVYIEGAYYSAPHEYRGRNLKVKVTENQIEIYFGMQRLAIWPRDRDRMGNRHLNNNHLPDKSKAYLETTPQNLLSQSKFLLPELHSLVQELFDADALGHLRRAQGLIRVCIKEINDCGREKAEPSIKASLEQMKRFNKIRVGYFQELLKFERNKTLIKVEETEREITRLPGNAMLRYEQVENLFGIVN
jgi:transposase